MFCWKINTRCFVRLCLIGFSAVWRVSDCSGPCSKTGSHFPVFQVSPWSPLVQHGVTVKSTLMAHALSDPDSILRTTLFRSPANIFVALPIIELFYRPGKYRVVYLMWGPNIGNVCYPPNPLPNKINIGNFFVTIPFHLISFFL